MSAAQSHKFCQTGPDAQCIDQMTPVTLQLPDCTCTCGFKKVTCERDPVTCKFTKTSCYLLADGVTVAPEGTKLAVKKPDFSYV